MKTILIVDDERMYLKSLELALKKHYRVHLANSLDGALQKLQEVKCDIALIDIRLDEEDEKNVDGLKILEWIKMNKPEVASFGMSAYAYQKSSYDEQARKLGARDFFKKPIDIVRLIAILKEKS